MVVKRTLNGTEVYVVEGFRTWVRAYELVKALGLNLSKQQIDAKLENTAMAGLIDDSGKKHWFVTWPRGVRMLANKCRPYTVEGMKFKDDLLGKKGLALVAPQPVITASAWPPPPPQKLDVGLDLFPKLPQIPVSAVEEKLRETRPGMWPASKYAPPPKCDPFGWGPNGKPDKIAHPVTFAEQPREASTVISALQNQLTLANQNSVRQEIRIRELSERLESGLPPKPEMGVPEKPLRALIRRHVASYVTKMVAQRGWDRQDPRFREWYHTEWIHLYTEFEDIHGINFRTRYNNLSEQERKDLGVSSPMDLMRGWVPTQYRDGAPKPMVDGRFWKAAPAEYQGVLPQFYALVYVRCPVTRYSAGTGSLFYDGVPVRSLNGQGKACRAQVF